MNRHDKIKKLTTEAFDVLIIGGGITGAGIALDAASRGLKTALLEKHDFAFGTSSRSTKLIHGGLRYLKQLEFGLVKEVGSERAVVHRLAPHLVIPEKMLLPLYEKRGMGSMLTSLGLKLYDWLAGVKLEDQRKMLTRSQTLQHEPLLNPSDIKGGAIYAEYRTDDARLTIEIVKTAQQHGATVLNYAQVESFDYQDGVLTGVQAIDHLSGKQFRAKAEVIVNAAGPWVDQIRDLDQSKQGKTLHLTKGVHVVIDREKLPIKQAIYFDVGDGRMIFAIPRHQTTYVGTTDTTYTGNLDEVITTPADVDYLLKAVNQTFVGIHLTAGDVVSSWAGLRPLIHEEGKSESELSRKDELFEAHSGLISIAGGKLTGYRKMAQRVVDRIVERNFDSRALKLCTTDSILLSGNSFHSYQDVVKFTKAVEEDLRFRGLSNYAGYLVATYGAQVTDVLRHLASRNEPSEVVSLALAELSFCVEREMVIMPSDFLVRRTGMLYFDMPRLLLVKDAVIQELERVLGVSLTDEREQLEKLIAQAKVFGF